MEPLSSLHLLAEAVRNAGADIAPTYQEYIQLAFAIDHDLPADLYFQKEQITEIQ